MLLIYAYKHIIHINNTTLTQTRSRARTHGRKLARTGTACELMETGKAFPKRAVTIIENLLRYIAVCTILFVCIWLDYYVYNAVDFSNTRDNIPTMMLLSTTELLTVSNQRRRINVLKAATCTYCRSIDLRRLYHHNVCISIDCTGSSLSCSFLLCRFILVWR